MARLSIGLGEYDTGWHDPGRSIERAATIIARARAQGAGLVALPEMCLTGFTMEPDSYAESLDGAGPRAISALARDHQIHVVAGLALKTGDGAYVNAAIVFDPRGGIVGEYRKQKLFQYADEATHYSAGDAPCVVTVEGLRIGLFICYDLRFPEVFRTVASEMDALLVIANWPTRRQKHWEALLTARAIENQCYAVGVNRLGTGGGMNYSGGSSVTDPWGEVLGRAAGSEPPLVVTLDSEEVNRVRREYPFLPRD